LKHSQKKDKMKIVTLSGSPRANVGKKDANQLRRSGSVPCVLYGGKEQVHFFADERAFKNILYTPDACFVEIDLAGKKTKALVQEAQYHKVNDSLLHVDFLELIPGKPVIIAIPVKLHGQAEGVKSGGRLILSHRKVKVKGDADKIPAQLDLNVEKLVIGKSITFGDVKLEGCELLGGANMAIVSVNVTRAVEEETPAAAATTEAAATPAADGKDAKAAPAADGKDAKAAPKK
jgi:large subunit ribosomal protein L25